MNTRREAAAAAAPPSAMQAAPRSLWLAASVAGLAGRWLWGAGAAVPLDALSGGTSLDRPLDELRGATVLLAVRDQLRAALALIELDGVARRIVLCPPGVPAEHIRALAATAEIDAVVANDGAAVPGGEAVARRIACARSLAPLAVARAAAPVAQLCATEWILLTSGTTGVPKLVVHTLASLSDPILGRGRIGGGAVWSTFYDIRRYGGLQIFLRAVIGGGSMVLSDADEPVADFFARAGAHGVTHISGTPSHWRRALMSPELHRMAPRYVRLSGEIADQAVLDRLRGAFPDADIAHAFASTEAGVAFDVGDGLAGFPADLVERRDAAVAMRVEDGSLRIKSARNAGRYLGGESDALIGPDGYVDTGDLVERRGERYYFVGRRGGVINIGGQKVHPEEIEAVINRHPRVRMSLVRARRNPIVGAVVVADIVPEPAELVGTAEGEALRDEVFAACRAALARHKVPAAIRLVGALDVGPAGKLARPSA